MDKHNTFTKISDERFFLWTGRLCALWCRTWVDFGPATLIGLGIIYYCRQQLEREKYRKHLSIFFIRITILQLVKPFIRLHFGIF